MKIRFCAALLLAALAISLFTGCALEPQLERMEDKVEHQLDALEETIENRLEAVLTDAPTPMAQAPATQPAALLTKEEVESIALEHAGLTADQVQALRTELDYDRGKPEYEVDFRQDRWEYDYEIDAVTGRIISWDKDWDD